MEIKEYKKLKSNVYEIKFKSGEAVKLYDEVILNYNLLITKNISNKEYEEIIKYNKSLDAYYLSLKYISKKLRCEKEIEKFIEGAKFGFESGFIRLATQLWGIDWEFQYEQFLKKQKEIESSILDSEEKK